MAEKRRHPRRAVPVEITARESGGHGELLWEGADLSPGGAFLKSDLLLEKGETFALEFALPGRARPFKSGARVAWVRRFPKAGEAAGMGVEFVSMSEDDRRALQAFLESSEGA